MLLQRTIFLVSCQLSRRRNVRDIKREKISTSEEEGLKENMHVL